MPNPFGYGANDEVLERAARAKEAMDAGKTVDTAPLKHPFGEDIPQWMYDRGMREAHSRDFYGMFEEAEAKTGRQHPRFRERAAKDLAEWWDSQFEAANVTKREAWEADYNLLAEGRISTRELEGNPLYAKRALEAEHAEARQRRARLDGFELNALKSFESQVERARVESEYAKGEAQRKAEAATEALGFGALDPRHPENQNQLRFVNTFDELFKEMKPQIDTLATEDQVRAVHRRMKEERIIVPDVLSSTYRTLLERKVGGSFPLEALGIKEPEAKPNDYHPDYDDDWKSPLSGKTAAQIRAEGREEEARKSDERMPLFGELA